MSVSAISNAALPADVRSAGTAAVNEYKTALGFEQMLVSELVKEMVPKDGPLAEGPYASTMQDTLTTALVGGQGLGLARRLYKEMQSS
jgi:Rod binding domain-containing protein